MGLNIKLSNASVQKVPGEIPTRFKRYVDRKQQKLNDPSPESKVVAALNKVLVRQGQSDKANYYVADDIIWCPDLIVTEGKKEDGAVNNSYKASGRFRIGKVNGDALTFGMMQFSIQFRDGEDEMGLQDLIIEEAVIDELPANTPLHE